MNLLTPLIFYTLLEAPSQLEVGYLKGSKVPLSAQVRIFIGKAKFSRIPLVRDYFRDKHVL